MSKRPRSQHNVLYVRRRECNIYVKPSLVTISRGDQPMVFNELEDQDVVFRIPHLNIKQNIEPGSQWAYETSKKAKGLYPFQVGTSEQSVSGTVVLHS